MKIAIMGYSGSGKSTLAQELAEYYGCPVFHFDAVQFLPGWEIRDQEEKDRQTKEFMDDNDSWVIDGNYSNLYWERRAEEADKIVLMLFNRINCLYRVTKRYFKYRNQTRPDMAEGCQEKLDWEFVWWILRDGRKKKSRERYKKLIEEYGEKVVVLKNQRALDAWKMQVFKKNKKN